MPPHSDPMNPQRRTSSYSDHRRDDQESATSASVSQTSRAPRSVYVASLPLTRELSDLSGSYANGQGSRNSIFGEPKPGNGPWRQAYVVSRVPPPTSKATFVASSVRGDTDIAMGRNDSVELVDDNLPGTLDMSKWETQGHNRIPVAVLLMDGTSHSYELLQIWIDRSIDSVRDIVQAVQRGIPQQWKQAYDGIFQVRGNRFTQLIHILRMTKYDVQPHEILIAKPFSMSAKVTIAFATSAIRHLTNVGIVNTDEEDNLGSRTFRPKSEKSPLVLSNAAQKRVYAPNGILSHHHAVDFLTFSPPFDNIRQAIDLTNDDTNSSIGSHFSSVGSAPTSNQRRVKVEFHNPLKASIQEESSIVENRQPPEPIKVENLFITSAPTASCVSSTVDHNHSLRVPNDESISSTVAHRGRKHVPYVMSQLNCCRSKERVPTFSCISDTTSSHELSATFVCCKNKEIDPPAVPSGYWQRLDTRPMAEDHSDTSRLASTRPTTSRPSSARASAQPMHVPSLSGIHAKPSSHHRPRPTRPIEI